MITEFPSFAFFAMWRRHFVGVAHLHGVTNRGSAYCRIYSCSERRSESVSLEHNRIPLQRRDDDSWSAAHPP